MSRPSGNPRPAAAGPSTAEALGLGLVAAVALVVPLIAGLLLGTHFGAPLAGVVPGLLLGIVAAGFAFYVRLKRYL